MPARESQGATIEIDDGGSPTNFIALGRVNAMSGMRGGSAAVIPTSHLGSTRVEKLMGLPDEGQVTFDLQIDPADAGQAAAIAARGARRLTDFRVTTASGTVWTFQGFVLSVPTNLAVDAVISGQLVVEISGEVGEA